MSLSRRRFLELTGISAALAALRSIPIQAAPLTHYIDPTVTVSGDGSMTNPWNSWTDVVWQEGDIYLQKAGTTWSGATLKPGANGVTLGKYGDGDLPVLKGLSTGTPPGVKYVISVVNTMDCTIQDLRFEGGTADMEPHGGIQIAGTVGSVVVRNCQLTFMKIGFHIENNTNNGILINNCEIWNFGKGPIDSTGSRGGDAIFAMCDNLEVRNCHIHTFHEYAEDGIQLANFADNVHLHHNRIDHAGSTHKHSIICSGRVIDKPTVIEYNELINNSNGINLFNSGIVRYNTILNTAKRAINLSANQSVVNVEIYGNLVVGAAHGVFLGVQTTEPNETYADIYNNTLVGLRTGGFSYYTAPYTISFSFRNNIVSVDPAAAEATIRLHDFNGSTSFDYNCMFPEHPKLFMIGSGYHDTLSKLQEASGTNLNSVAADPSFISDNDYHLAKGSPCAEKGVWVADSKTDLEGKPFHNPPSIGAYEVGPLKPFKPTITKG